MRRLIFLSTLFILGAGSVFADDYPSHPIHLIVPYAAGGSADATARVLAKQIGKRTGQAIVVENRGGRYIGLPSRFLYGAIEGSGPSASAA